MTRYFLALVAAAPGAMAFAGVINVPGDFATIQGAIDAVRGDEIVVAAGTYLEHIDFTGKAVTVRSAGGPALTTIDGESTGTVVTCVNGEGPDTVLRGFTITGGLTAGGGGGMAVHGASPTVVDCIFLGNVAGLGGGMFNQDAHPTVTNCAFVANSGGSAGGAVHNGGLGGSHPALANCLFRANSADVGGAIFNQASNPTLINCTITSNAAAVLAGGIFNDGSNPVVVNCILWGNTPDQVFNVTSTPSVTYSDVQGGAPGLGNINADPRFVDAAGGDLRLDRFSPCVDAANNAAVPPDASDLDGDGDAKEPLPVDLAGVPRLFDDAGVSDSGASPTGPPLADMGAFERQETRSRPRSTRRETATRSWSRRAPTWSSSASWARRSPCAARTARP